MSLRFRKYFVLYLVPVVLFLVLVGGISRLSLAALCAIFFALVFSLLAAVAMMTLPLHQYAVSSPAAASATTTTLPLAVSPAPEKVLPYVPTSAHEAHALLSDTEFEYLAAAVVMARDKHYFEARSGGSGDRGVDVRLRNHFGLLVLVQAKRYDPSGSVPSYQIRDFSGTLGTQDAAYGYFVTTAKLTRDGRADKERSPRRMHLIEGWLLDVLLSNYHREIAQCLSMLQSLEGRSV